MFQENSIETCILSRVKQITGPGWMHETSARTWCPGRTWSEQVGREVGGGIGMGKTCEPKAFSFQCMTKFTTKKKKRHHTRRLPKPSLPCPVTKRKDSTLCLHHLFCILSTPTPCRTSIHFLLHSFPISVSSHILAPAARLDLGLSKSITCALNQPDPMLPFELQVTALQ